MGNMNVGEFQEQEETIDEERIAEMRMERERDIIEQEGRLDSERLSFQQTKAVAKNLVIVVELVKYKLPTYNLNKMFLVDQKYIYAVSDDGYNVIVVDIEPDVSYDYPFRIDLDSLQESTRTTKILSLPEGVTLSLNGPTKIIVKNAYPGKTFTILVKTREGFFRLSLNF